MVQHREFDAGSDRTAAAGEPVCFTDAHAQAAAPDTALGLAWEFDDGATATDERPCHAFAAAGVYTVRVSLTVERPDEAPETLVDTARVTVT